MDGNRPMEPGADLVMREAHGWEEHDMTPVTPEEKAAMFQANDIASWRKDNAKRFKPVPKPSRAERVIAWFRRLFQ